MFRTSEIDRLEAYIKSTYAQDPFPYLSNRFLIQTREFYDYGLVNQGQFSGFQWVILIASGLTPFFISIQSVASSTQSILGVSATTWLKVLPLITALIVAILSPTLQIFNFQSRRQVYRLAYVKLLSEFHTFDADAATYCTLPDSGAKRRQFVDHAEKIITDTFSPTPV